uniref:DUF223 domain-containing protein n=1 Tax=Oryza punctata TaxID=4537 RepID=A0A0E0K9I8_ORYPU
MAPTNLNRKRTYAQLVRARPVAHVRPFVHARPVVHRRFKYFDDVEFDDCRVNKAFSVIVKGSKMKAIISGENAARFKNILIEGQKYTIHGVYFQPNSWELNFRAIKRDYDCFFTRTTIVGSYNLPLQFPLYPKQLTKFSDLSLPEHRNKMSWVNTAGLIVYLGPLQRVSNRLYREVTLLDARCELVVIGVYANHLITHMLQWASAIAKNHVVVGTMLQLDRTYWCLESSDHSQFYFNPSYQKVHELKNFRRYVVNGEVNLGFVDRCHVTRLLRITEVLDSKSSFKTNNRNA